jgi:hypothetical protein
MLLEISAPEQHLPYQYSNVAIAAWTTALGRVKLLRELVQSIIYKALHVFYCNCFRCILPTKGQIAYCDTDSVIWLQTPTGDPLGTEQSTAQPIFGELLSELHNESENPAVEFLSLGAKR